MQDEGAAHPWAAGFLLRWGERRKGPQPDAVPGCPALARPAGAVAGFQREGNVVVLSLEASTWPEPYAVLELPISTRTARLPAGRGGVDSGSYQ